MEFRRDEKPNLFARTLPVEILKLILSMAAIESTGYENKIGHKKVLKMYFIDFSRAFFHAPSVRKVYIELPPEDREEGMRGMLENSMYGKRVHPIHGKNRIRKKKDIFMCI